MGRKSNEELQRKKESKWRNDWQKEHLRRYNIAFNIANDADVIEKLNSVPAKNQYIAKLIREDMKKEIKETNKENRTMRTFVIRAVYQTIERSKVGDEISGDFIEEMVKYHGASFEKDPIMRDRTGYDFYRLYGADGTFFLLQRIDAGASNPDDAESTEEEDREFWESI